jgi:hypothetical protein
MDMHEDLRWLAKYVSKWPEHATFIKRDKDFSEGFVESERPDLFERHNWVSHDQWQAARQQLEDERIATPEEDEEWQAMGERQKRSKYHVQIRPGVYVDVYDVLHAFGVTNPGDQHAIKKMLMPGKRGHKDAIHDRREAIQSLERAIELEEGK